MSFAASLQLVLALAAREAQAARFAAIEPEHLLLGLLKLAEIDAGELPIEEPAVVSQLREDQQRLRAILADRGLLGSALRRQLRAALGRGAGRSDSSGLHRSPAARELFIRAEAGARKAGDEPVCAHHMLACLLEHPTPVLGKLLEQQPQATALEPSPLRDDAGSASRQGLATQQGLAALSERLRLLRRELRAKVFGQDHAIEAFVEGLFNAELVAGADSERRRPQAIFVFAGPPGVGKTFLAESGAALLERPFKRFDMSAYSDHQSGSMLYGTPPSYKGAQPGQLTGFVKSNPPAVLLFDEVEKAHLNVIQLFLQVLDAGVLEDKHTETSVSFRDTMLIFTTNAGVALYDRQNTTGVTTANAGFHRHTILDALAKEIDPRTGQPFFPQALCSRLATGYPLLFNRLGVSELERVAKAELERQAGLLEQAYGLRVQLGEVVAACLVLREGAAADARTVRSQAESFIKSEVHKLCRLYRADRLEQVLERAKLLLFDLDPAERLTGELADLLQPVARPSVLLVADRQIAALWVEHLPSIDWITATSLPEVTQHLDTGEVDLVLLDLWLGFESLPELGAGIAGPTMAQFDNVPVSATGISEAREILSALHERYPQLPCYLLSLRRSSRETPILDEELFLACVRAGGARGVVESGFDTVAQPGWEAERDSLGLQLAALSRRARCQLHARRLADERKHLVLETAPRLQEDGTRITVRLRNLRLTRAVAADDASELLDAVERPDISFDDVYGGESAKAELRYIVDWLQDPKRYRALGLRTPRGVLLHGHPGTGKTMLARALAGESRTAFLVASAASFITKWQGSGPQAVRDLFERARRYAPAIVFIDEIDAIGKKRVGSMGASAAAEQTLNSLLTEMDGFSTPALRPAIVIAATNLVDLLDDALRRRFDREIEVDRPDRSARRGYLRKRLWTGSRHRVGETVIDRLAGQSAGMTIAELERVIELAGRMASRGDGIISDALIEEAFESIRTGEARPAADRDTLLRVARHEAGHALVGWLAGRRPVQVTIMARGRAGGFVEREADEDRLLVTKPEIEAGIRQAMAGRAAEILYYGAEDGLSSGAGGDLEVATRQAEAMVRRYGMDPVVGQVVLDAKRIGDGPLAVRAMRAVERIVAAQLEQALAELSRHRQALDQLVDLLMERNRLTRDELEELLPTIPPVSAPVSPDEP